MKKLKLRQIILLAFFLFALSFGLSGCFKGNISVEVKPNGSGVVSISFGMTQKAKMLISSQGENPFQDINQSMSGEDGSIPTDVKVTNWTEGDYEWTKAEKEFKNLNEINKIFSPKSLFNHFSLTRKRGIFKNEFILDAELSPFSTSSPSSDIIIDPTAFININFSARLPGKITETNGFVNANDPNLVVWNMEGYQTVSVKARSLTWNWLNIFGIFMGSCIFILIGVYALGGFEPILHRRSQNNKDFPIRSQPIQPKNVSSVPQSSQLLQYQNGKTNYIVDLNIEDLLIQINTYTLNSIGQLYKKSGEIALVWKDRNGKQKFIDVKELGNNSISINGQMCLATKENIKSELINALKKQMS